MRDVSRLTFDELAEEGELLVIRHDVRGTANLPLCDEHFQMGHHLVFQLLEGPNGSGSDRKRVWAMNGGKEGDCQGRERRGGGGGGGGF